MSEWHTARGVRLWCPSPPVRPMVPYDVLETERGRPPVDLEHVDSGPDLPFAYVEGAE